HREVQQLGAVAAPPDRGLDAHDEQDVPPGRGVPRQQHAGGRPLQGPLAVDEPDPRSVDLEVVVVLGVHGRDQRGVPGAGQVLDRGGGALPGVVPSLEGRDDDGVVQLGDCLEFDHQASWSRAPRPTLRGAVPAWPRIVRCAATTCLPPSCGTWTAPSWTPSPTGWPRNGPWSRRPVGSGAMRTRSPSSVWTCTTRRGSSWTAPRSPAPRPRWSSGSSPAWSAGPGSGCRGGPVRGSCWETWWRRVCPTPW